MKIYGNKEKVYMEKVVPLIKQLAEISKQEGINFVMAAQLTAKEEGINGTKMAVSMMVPDKENANGQFRFVCQFLESGGEILTDLIDQVLDDLDQIDAEEQKGEGKEVEANRDELNNLN